MIGCGFLIQLPLGTQGVGHPFVAFLVSALIIALMFGRPSGFLAVAISSFLTVPFFAPGGSIQLDLLEIELYAGLAVAAVVTVDKDSPHAHHPGRYERSARQRGHETLSGAKSRIGSRTTSPRLTRSSGKGPWLLRIPRFNSHSGRPSDLVHLVARLNNRLNFAGDVSAVDSGIFVPDLCEDLQACARPGVAIECRAESP